MATGTLNCSCCRSRVSDTYRKDSYRCRQRHRFCMKCLIILRKKDELHPNRNWRNLCPCCVPDGMDYEVSVGTLSVKTTVLKIFDGMGIIDREFEKWRKDQKKLKKLLKKLAESVERGKWKYTLHAIATHPLVWLFGLGVTGGGVGGLAMYGGSRLAMWAIVAIGISLSLQSVLGADMLLNIYEAKNQDELKRIIQQSDERNERLHEAAAGCVTLIPGLARKYQQSGFSNVIGKHTFFSTFSYHSIQLEKALDKILRRNNVNPSESPTSQSRGGQNPQQISMTFVRICRDLAADIENEIELIRTLRSHSQAWD